MERFLYDGQVKLSFDERFHRYCVSLRGLPPGPEWGDPQSAPSVTSILSAVGSEGALIQWAANCAADWIHCHLSAGSTVTEQDVLALANGARTAYSAARMDAADVGTQAHEWIRKFVEAGMPDVFELPEEPRTRAACEAAKQWMDSVNYWPLMTETCLYSRKYHYAGTLDMVGMVSTRGAASIVDWKTSKRIYPKHRMQTAAYCQAYSEMSGLKIRHRWVVRIGKNGELEPLYLPPETLKHDLRAFLAAKEVYEYLKKYEYLKENDENRS